MNTLTEITKNGRLWKGRERIGFVIAALLMIVSTTAWANQAGQPEKNRICIWGGFGLQKSTILNPDYRNDVSLVGMPLTLSLSRYRQLLTLRWSGHGTLWDQGEEFRELSLLYGYVRKQKLFLYSAAAGIGAIRGWLQRNDPDRIYPGIPAELQAIFHFGLPVGLCFRLHGFFSNYLQVGWSVGLQFGRFH